MSFGAALSRLRRARGWSQETLAFRAGLSQRHISFLETGRSHPGQHSLGKLSAALALRAWEQRALAEALAPAVIETPAQPLHPATIATLVERFTSWPAYAFHLEGSLMATNTALRSLLDMASPNENLWQATAPVSGPNIYDLVFHPRGLVRWMDNPHEVIPETLRRLRIESAQNLDLLPVLKRIESYPAVDATRPVGNLSPPMLVERYRIQGRTLAIISMISHLASPGELLLDQLRIESFVPADTGSEALLRDISAAASDKLACR